MTNLPEELVNKSLYEIIKIDEPKNLLGLINDRKVYFENGLVYMLKIGGDGEIYSPLFSFYAPAIDRKYSEDKEAIALSDKINVSFPDELIELDKTLKENYKFLKKDYSDLKFTKQEIYFIDCGFDIVTGGESWYTLSSKTTLSVWNKIRPFFKYYREPSDDLDLSMCSGKKWVTEKKERVTEILKKEGLVCK